MVWPGRFDVVSRAPLVILDCAHNELSVEALLETIAVELGPEVRPRLVFGCLEDKQMGADGGVAGAAGAGRDADRRQAQAPA